MLKVGQVAVVFHQLVTDEGEVLGSFPVSHNSPEFPDHDCRGTVLKVGRKNYTVSSIGSPIICRIDGKGGKAAFSIEDAKVKHRANFGGPKEWRTAEFINQVIEEL